MGAIITWWVYYRQKKISEKQDELLNHIADLEERNKTMLNKILSLEEKLRLCSKNKINNDLGNSQIDLQRSQTRSIEIIISLVLVLILI